MRCQIAEERARRLRGKRSYSASLKRRVMSLARQEDWGPARVSRELELASSVLYRRSRQAEAEYPLRGPQVDSSKPILLPVFSSVWSSSSTVTRGKPPMWRLRCPLGFGLDLGGSSPPPASCCAAGRLSKFPAHTRDLPRPPRGLSGGFHATVTVLPRALRSQACRRRGRNPGATHMAPLHGRPAAVLPVALGEKVPVLVVGGWVISIS